MFGIDDAILGGALSFGGSLLSGFGARSAAKKQQKVANAWAYVNNLKAQQEAERKSNEDKAIGERMVQQASATGREMIARADAMDDFDAARYKADWGDKFAFDMSNFMSAGQKAGFNPVTWLNSGAMSFFDNRNVAASMSQFYDNRAVKESLLVAGYGMNAGQMATAGYQQMSPSTATFQSPESVNVPSVAQAIGGAVTAGSNQYFALEQNQQRFDLQKQYLGSIMAAVQKGRASGNKLAGLGTPAFSTTGGTRVSGGARDVSTPPPYGITDTRNATADEVTKYYGQAIGEGAGILKGIGDAWRSMFPYQANPAKDYGFGTGFAPNIANDRLPRGSFMVPEAWSSWLKGGQAVEQPSWPPLFGN